MSVTRPYTVSLNINKHLVQALKAAASVATKSLAGQALRCVKLSFDGDDLTVEATDLVVWYRQTIFMPGLDVIQPFSVMVDGAVLSKIKSATEAVFNEKFYVFNNINYIPISWSEDFPRFPTLSNDAHKIALEKQYFSDFADVAMSASDSEVRPILTAVCHRENSLLATDGLRLYIAEQPLSWPKEVNVPAEYARLLKKTFAESGSWMANDEFYTRYHGNGFDITIKNVDGTYPGVSRVIPMSTKTIGVIADVNPWISACDAVLMMHNQIKKEYRDLNNTLSLSINESSLTISAKSSEAEFKTEIPFSIAGPPLTIACNARFLKDALMQIGDGAEIGFNSNKQPFVAKSTRKTALVSPINLR